MDNLPIDRIKDNRLKGLLREIQEAIADMDDPEALKKLGQSLKMMGDRARNRGWYLLPEEKREFW